MEKFYSTTLNLNQKNNGQDWNSKHRKIKKKNYELNLQEY